MPFAIAFRVYFIIKVYSKAAIFSFDFIHIQSAKNKKWGNYDKKT